MQRKHIAFILESAYGHILPTLGVSAELLTRGYHVSYAVSKDYSAGVTSIRAESRVYEPLNYKVDFLPTLNQAQAHDIVATMKLWNEFEQREIHSSLHQLHQLYQNNEPDLVLYDLRNMAGKIFAQERGIQAIEHSPMVIEHGGRENILGGVYDERLVMISLPRMFQAAADSLNHRFRFTGFCGDGREAFFNSWDSATSASDMVLIAGTTAGLSQHEFFDVAACALKDFTGRVILSLGHSDAMSLGQLPPNFQINPRCSNFSILRDCKLFIGQGGQGSTLEALYWGVPVILIPPNECDRTFIEQVVDLGFGFSLDPVDASAESIRSLASQLLENNDVRKRLEAVRDLLQRENGSKIGADLIEQFI